MIVKGRETMTVNKDDRSKPERFGISKTEILYLIIIRKLEHESCDVSQLTNHIKDSLNEFGKVPQKTHIYDVINSMEVFKWIRTESTYNRSRILGLTAEGKEKLDWFEHTYLLTIKKMIEQVHHFHHYIIRDKQFPASTLDEREMKLFNRTVNVQLMLRYFFLEYLMKHDDVTRLEFVRSMLNEHNWSFNSSYFYQITKELEHEDIKWVIGQWNDPRFRRECRYNITPAGRQILQHEREETIKSLQEILIYLTGVQSLLKQ